MKRLTKYVAVLAALVLMITGVSSSVIVSNERDLSPDFSGKQAPLPSYVKLAYYRDVFVKWYGDKVFVEMVTGIPTLV